VVSTSPASPSQNRRDGCVLPSSFSPVFRVTRDRAVQANSDRVQPSQLTKKFRVRATMKQCVRHQPSRRGRVDILHTGMDGDMHRIADVIRSRMIRALSHVIHDGERPHARNQLALHLPFRPFMLARKLISQQTNTFICHNYHYYRAETHSTSALCL
jgi:hypothetical protein